MNGWNFRNSNRFSKVIVAYDHEKNIPPLETNKRNQYRSNLTVKLTINPAELISPKLS
jgi:hypothetical protein